MKDGEKEATRIIIIDDSELSRKSIQELLEKNSFNVIGVAKDANDSLEILKQRDANLFIIDVVLPDINGIEIAKQFKDNFPKAHFIIISTINAEHLIIETLTIGIQDFLVKPISDDDLLDTVTKHAEIIFEESRIEREVN